MRKILRNKDISDKKFRLLILKSMKNNIDILMECGEALEKEINKWFVEYRSEIINEFIIVNDTVKRDTYIKRYIKAITSYEKIRRRQILQTFNRFGNGQNRKKEEMLSHLEIINSGRYSIDKSWRSSKSMTELLAIGPIAETSNCLKIKSAIKDKIDDSTKELMELLPERLINALIMQKYKVFRAHITNLFSGKTKLALENFPLIDKHVTINKLHLGYVKFKVKKDNSITAYIGYKKDSKLYPYKREKYEFSICNYDNDTIENINREGISITDITPDVQYQAYITKEKKDDSYILYIEHGVRMEYEDLVCNDKSLILRTNDETHTLEPVNNLLEGYKKINIKNSDTNLIIRELLNKYNSLACEDITKDKSEYKKSIISISEEIRITYDKLSLNMAHNIENYCIKNNTNIVIIYYIPDAMFNNTNENKKIPINGKILKYNLLKYLSEMGIECIIIDQTNCSSNLYRMFKKANVFPENFIEINKYILDKLKTIEFSDDVIKKISKHNSEVLKKDRNSIKHIYYNGNSNYYL